MCDILLTSFGEALSHTSEQKRFVLNLTYAFTKYNIKYSLPLCTYILWITVPQYILSKVIGYSVLGFILMALNILAVHKAMENLGRFLGKLEF